MEREDYERYAVEKFLNHIRLTSVLNEDIIRRYMEENDIDEEVFARYINRRVSDFPTLLNLIRACYSIWMKNRSQITPDDFKWLIRAANSILPEGEMGKFRAKTDASSNFPVEMNLNVTLDFYIEFSKEVGRLFTLVARGIPIAKNTEIRNIPRSSNNPMDFWVFKTDERTPEQREADAIIARAQNETARVFEMEKVQKAQREAERREAERREAERREAERREAERREAERWEAERRNSIISRAEQAPPPKIKRSRNIIDTTELVEEDYNSVECDGGFRVGSQEIFVCRFDDLRAVTDVLYSDNDLMLALFQVEDTIFSRFSDILNKDALLMNVPDLRDEMIVLHPSAERILNIYRYKRDNVQDVDQDNAQIIFATKENASRATELATAFASLGMIASPIAKKMRERTALLGDRFVFFYSFSSLQIESLQTRRIIYFVTAYQEDVDNILEVVPPFLEANKETPTKIVILKGPGADYF